MAAIRYDFTSPKYTWRFNGVEWPADRPPVFAPDMVTVTSTLHVAGPSAQDLTQLRIDLETAAVGVLEVMGQKFRACASAWSMNDGGFGRWEIRVDFAVEHVRSRTTYNPPRSSCCGAEEGMVCAPDCDRRRAAEACHREAIALVAREYGWFERVIEQSYESATPVYGTNPSTIARAIRTAVDKAREEARRKMGRCEHFMLPAECDAGCDPLELAAGEELDRIAARFGLSRCTEDTDEVVREWTRAARAGQIRVLEARSQGKAHDVLSTFARACSTPISFHSRPAEVGNLARELTARAAHVGVKVDPRETCEELRERIEAVLSGDTRAAEPKTWQAEKERRTKRTKAARDIALATGQSTSDVESAIRSVENVSRGLVWTDWNGKPRRTCGRLVQQVVGALRGHARRQSNQLADDIGASQVDICGALCWLSERGVVEDGTGPDRIAAHKLCSDESAIQAALADAVSAHGALVVIAPRSVEVRLPTAGVILYQLDGVMKRRDEHGNVETLRAKNMAEAVRAENLRVGAELAKNPPAWAYPLGWTLAVSALVEERNCRATPQPLLSPFVMLSKYFGRYHDARLRGMTETCAMDYAFDPDATAATDEIRAWLAPFCAAYERGRGAPGGERLGRPA